MAPDWHSLIRVELGAFDRCGHRDGVDWRISWLAVSDAKHEVGQNLVVTAHADMAAAELILEAPIDPLAERST